MEPFVNPPRPRRRVLRLLLVAIAVPIVSSVVAVFVLRFVPPPTTAFMLAHRLGGGGSPMQQWMPLERIAPSLAIAVVAAEDQTFPSHHGFDVASIEDAWEERARGGTRGASTISQQVAKNLFLWSRRSFVRKGIEAWFTVLVEAMWSKRRILEVYLNVAEFGPGVYGAEAAARRHFGKPASRLGAHESALLAAVLPNPRKMHAGRPSAYVSRRARWIERQAAQLGGPAYVGAE